MVLTTFLAIADLVTTCALNCFGSARAVWELAVALDGVRAGVLLGSFAPDWRLPPAQSREMLRALLKNQRPVTYAEINASHGHDAFLLGDPRYHAVVQGYYDRIAQQLDLPERYMTTGVLA